MTEVSKGIAAFGLHGEDGGGERLRKIYMPINGKYHSRKPKSSAYFHGKGKGNAIPLQAWTGPEGSKRLRLPDFKTIGFGRW
jgi:hypothetical protein